MNTTPISTEIYIALKEPDQYMRILKLTEACKDITDNFPFIRGRNVLIKDKKLTRYLILCLPFLDSIVESVINSLMYKYQNLMQFHQDFQANLEIILKLSDPDIDYEQVDNKSVINYQRSYKSFNKLAKSADTSNNLSSLEDLVKHVFVPEVHMNVKKIKYRCQEYAKKLYFIFKKNFPDYYKSIVSKQPDYAVLDPYRILFASLTSEGTKKIKEKVEIAVDDYMNDDFYDSKSDFLEKIQKIIKPKVEMNLNNLSGDEMDNNSGISSIGESEQEYAVNGQYPLTVISFPDDEVEGSSLFAETKHSLIEDIQYWLFSDEIPNFAKNERTGSWIKSDQTLSMIYKFICDPLKYPLYSKIIKKIAESPEPHLDLQFKKTSPIKYPNFVYNPEKHNWFYYRAKRMMNALFFRPNIKTIATLNSGYIDIFYKVLEEDVWLNPKNKANMEWVFRLMQYFQIIDPVTSIKSIIQYHVIWFIFGNIEITTGRATLFHIQTPGDVFLKISNKTSKWIYNYLRKTEFIEFFVSQFKKFDQGQILKKYEACKKIEDISKCFKDNYQDPKDDHRNHFINIFHSFFNQNFLQKHHKQPEDFDSNRKEIDGFKLMTISMIGKSQKSLIGGKCGKNVPKPRPSLCKNMISIGDIESKSTKELTEKDKQNMANNNLVAHQEKFNGRLMSFKDNPFQRIIKSRTCLGNELKDMEADDISMGMGYVLSSKKDKISSKKDKIYSSSREVLASSENKVIEGGTSRKNIDIQDCGQSSKAPFYEDLLNINNMGGHVDHGSRKSNRVLKTSSRKVSKRGDQSGSVKRRSQNEKVQEVEPVVTILKIPMKMTPALLAFQKMIKNLMFVNLFKQKPTILKTDKLNKVYDSDGKVINTNGFANDLESGTQEKEIPLFNTYKVQFTINNDIKTMNYEIYRYILKQEVLFQNYLIYDNFTTLLCDLIQNMINTALVHKRNEPLDSKNLADLQKRETKHFFNLLFDNVTFTEGLIENYLIKIHFCLENRFFFQSGIESGQLCNLILTNLFEICEDRDIRIGIMGRFKMNLTIFCMYINKTYAYWNNHPYAKKSNKKKKADYKFKLPGNLFVDGLGNVTLCLIETQFNMALADHEAHYELLNKIPDSTHQVLYMCLFEKCHNNIFLTKFMDFNKLFFKHASENTLQMVILRNNLQSDIVNFFMNFVYEENGLIPNKDIFMFFYKGWVLSVKSAINRRNCPVFAREMYASLNWQYLQNIICENVKDKYAVLSSDFNTENVSKDHKKSSSLARLLQVKKRESILLMDNNNSDFNMKSSNQDHSIQSFSPGVTGKNNRLKNNGLLSKTSSEFGSQKMQRFFKSSSNNDMVIEEHAKLNQNISEVYTNKPKKRSLDGCNSTTKVILEDSREYESGNKNSSKNLKNMINVQQQKSVKRISNNSNLSEIGDNHRIKGLPAENNDEKNLEIKSTILKKSKFKHVIKENNLLSINENSRKQIVQRTHSKDHSEHSNVASLLCPNNNNKLDKLEANVRFKSSDKITNSRKSQDSFVTPIKNNQYQFPPLGPGVKTEMEFSDGKKQKGNLMMKIQDAYSTPNKDSESKFKIRSVTNKSSLDNSIIKERLNLDNTSNFQINTRKYSVPGSTDVSPLKKKNSDIGKSGMNTRDSSPMFRAEMNNLMPIPESRGHSPGIRVDKINTRMQKNKLANIDQNIKHNTGTFGMKKNMV